MSDETKPCLSRRSILSIGGGVAITPPAFGAVAATSPPQRAVGDRRSHVTVGEGTNIAPALSPDGRTIAFDLYGVLWLVDVAGGPARRLTDDFGDIAMPDWSPDGMTLVFQSYRTGNFQLWTIGADGSGLKQLTTGPFDCREPRFSPDGKRIAFSSDRTGSYGLYVLSLADGAISTLVDGPGEEYEPAWSPDGAEIAFVTDKTRIEVVDKAGVRRTVASIPASGGDPFSQSELRSPAFTRDGRSVIYTHLSTGASRLMRDGAPLLEGEDVFPFRVTWFSADEYLYASGGKLRRRSLSGGSARVIEFSATVAVTTPDYPKKAPSFTKTGPQPVVGIGSPVLSPDGRRIAFRALNELWLMPTGGKPEPLTRDGFHKCNPAFSPDGKQLAYSTDRGGKLDLWIRDLSTGQERQLTRLPHAAVSGNWSPDGARIVFLDQTGAVHTVEVGSGAVQQIHGAMWEPGRPCFSPDGRTVMLAAFKPYSARYREGLSEILTIDRVSGEATYAALLPHTSLGTRGDDGPVWSPDGTRIAFVLGSLLRVAPVDAKGRITGPIQTLNGEVTDAPSWSGDSRSLLYLSNGKLRLIPAAGGAPTTVPFSMTWAVAKPPARTLIRAGRLWDGHGPEVKRKVDILVEDGRIASVTPSRGAPPSGIKVVDASALTVIPGLIDLHTHREMQGYGYGDRMGRLWLAFGVTTTRSPGGPAYHAIEERESIDSGARIGPRYFATGEAIDGSRIYYNFMRPVADDAQLALELQRARALGYDLLKSYVRAPLQQQQAVAEWGHRQGVPTTSHYHYPALSFGLDGMEHLGATSRFGYSRTVSPSGAGYEDVTSLFAHAGARRTPTLFTAGTLLADDPGLATDPRIRALYPVWERKKIEDRVRAVSSADQTAARVALANNVAQVKAMLRGGGKVVSGTDSPIDLTAVSLHLNLRGMVKYGVSPYEALLTATRFSGEFLGVRIGVVEPGALADLAVVEGDPLTRIEDAARVRWAVKAGVVYGVDELMSPFAHADSAETHRHNPVLAAVPPHAASDRYWWHSAEYVETGRHACCADVLTLGFFRPKQASKPVFRAESV